jgi:hypothetical protein
VARTRGGPHADRLAGAAGRAVRVLLVGRTASVIDDVIQALDAPEADFSTANTLGEVQDILTQSRVDHVIVGGGLDLQTRLQIVQHVFDTSSSTTVHMNSP